MRENEESGHLSIIKHHIEGESEVVMNTDNGKTYNRIADSDTGGMSLRILLVAVTLILIGGSLFFLLEKQKKVNRINHRKAIELSDYGFQQVMEQTFEKLQNDPEQITGIAKTEYNRGWYKVSVSTTRKDSTLLLAIESEGCSGKQSVVQERNIILFRTFFEGDSVWMPEMKR